MKKPITNRDRLLFLDACYTNGVEKLIVGRFWFVTTIRNCQLRTTYYLTNFIVGATTATASIIYPVLTTLVE